MTNVNFPYQFDSQGRTSIAADDDHVEDMIEQLLFTSAGERVMLPELGSGLLQMVFAPTSSEVAAALQFTVQAALQRWLGDVVEVRELTAVSEDSTLRVSIVYSIRKTQETRTRVFERSLV